ncbi:hypothetical protein [Stenotrophomonas lactitubi]|uniref:hypothetical protein n=2 Tax=Stenotrophomonas TaxID=40323 RepID=UPI001DB6E437|nr:hypothetical protein [Stenotrophomonas lactitubi]CAH0260620.1 hypothetical protein SRABI122_03380 [Stenotrophomonas lactitubi]CAH0271562.1 hypothetical protein SRABI81_03729 [Stenotrophomonas lactitubi]CAH0275541.1 hypothetical protein SRABI102_03676 [Stenotrophomonas lactitubi]CAH0279357.1 hypothetical protein SRABI66_03966 [Stenotrophomonas lactitubi]
MTPRMWKAALVAILLSLPLAPAVASGDLFYFEAKHGKLVFTLMLVGREDPGEVNVSWSGPSAPDAANVRRRYYIEFDRARKRAYVRPLHRDGLPWFEMDVSGGRGNVLFAGKRLQGTADWTIQ